MLPEGIEATPHDAPAGLHYLYQRRDIFVATDDYERLFATKVEALAAVGVRKADPCDPESRHPSRDEVLADLGFTRLRTISDDVYLPQAVIDLRAPQHVRNAWTGRVEEVLPRVSPNHVMSLHPHAFVAHRRARGGRGPAEQATPPGRPAPRRRRRHHRAPGHGNVDRSTGLVQRERPGRRQRRGQARRRRQRRPPARRRARHLHRRPHAGACSRRKDPGRRPLRHTRGIWRVHHRRGSQWRHQQDGQFGCRHHQPLARRRHPSQLRPARDRQHPRESAGIPPTPGRRRCPQATTACPRRYIRPPSRG